ncbi:MAG: LysE family transporter, partial [Flavobacteriales bacterium]|nr:LysE family transporter [Flavobacteriales bacterium]
DPRPGCVMVDILPTSSAAVIIHVLLLLLLAMVVSFIGSLQAGLVNTAVLATTIRKGKEAGMRMAWGGSIPEFIYAALAFQGAQWLLELPALAGGMLERIAGVFLIAFGLYLMFLLKPFTVPERGGDKVGGFWKGVLVGLMNPQLLVFWTGVRVSFGTFGLEASGWVDLVAFGLGAFLGALALLFLLVKLGDRLLSRFGPNTVRTVFRILGATLVVLGALALVQGLQ